MRLDQWAKEVRTLLSSSGVPIALDRRDLRIPGAFIAPKAIRQARLDRTAEVVWDVVVVGTGSGNVAAMADLGRMLDKLTAIVAPDDGDMTADWVQLPNHAPDGLPAFTYTITTECED